MNESNHLHTIGQKLDRVKIDADFSRQNLSKVEVNPVKTLISPSRQRRKGRELVDPASLEEVQIDSSMLQAIGQRDVVAFQQFYKKFSGLLYTTIHRVLNDHQDTEDVMQEVLVQIWQKAHLYEPSKGKPLTWVTTLARNRAIDRIRSKQRRARLNDDFEQESRSVQPEFDEDTSDLLISKESDEAVQSAVMDLTPEQREAIQLAYFNGLTQSEIATRLNEPLGTVKARIRRGVQRLEQTVKRRI
jgi:RNA polymerase sigma-70 factor (ECF subfamily)